MTILKRVEDLYELTVEEIMNMDVWDLPTIAEGEPLTSLLSILGRRGYAYVLDEEGKLVGIVTAKDILHIIAPRGISYTLAGTSYLRGISATKVGEIMRKRVITARKGEKIKNILRKMRDFNVRRIPVVDEEGKLLGEVSLTSLLSLYAQLLHRT
ncbi:MAG TPA: CBS domain-containing protein [Aciduliprofundum sp.]|nr:CBS domain-containing protein [Aciduliprofundum sp.]